MKNTFTKEFRAILERKLRVYYRHYCYHITKGAIPFKEFIQKSANKDIFNRPLRNSPVGDGLCSPDDWIEVTIGRAHFGFLDTAHVIARLYRNANCKDCRC